MSQICLINVSFWKQVVFKFGTKLQNLKNLIPSNSFLKFLSFVSKTCLPKLKNLKNSISSNSFIKFLSFIFKTCVPKLKNLSEPLSFFEFSERFKFCTPHSPPTGEEIPPYRGGFPSPWEKGFLCAYFFTFLPSPHLGDKHD